MGSHLKIAKIEKRWAFECINRNVIWKFDYMKAASEQPHAILTSEDHSDGFIMCKIILGDSTLRREAAADLVEIYMLSGYSIDDIDVVAGPGTGATKLARSVAEEIARRRRKSCGWISPRKVTRRGVETMQLTSFAKRLIPGKRILVVDDAFTRGSTLCLMSAALLPLEAIVLPEVLVFANRSAITKINDKVIMSLIREHMAVWSPDSCTLCEEESVAMSPKRPAENMKIFFPESA
jgi:orotate phosphoribosyltransferase